MKRRAVLQLSAAMLASPALVLAQTSKRFRLGCLWTGSEANIKPLEQAFVSGLRDRGYVVGQNVIVDFRYAEGDSGRFPVLVDELIALRPDVLVGIESVAAAMKVRTSIIPIVLIASADPVGAGLVESLARPGTNVTGLTGLGAELVAKHIELLTEVVPKMSRVALLVETSTDAETRARYEMVARMAAKKKGLTLVVTSARDSQSLRKGFAVLEKERPDGLVMAPSAVLFNLRREILDDTRRLRLPAISGYPQFAESGLLLSYGVNLLESFRYAASYVDRILKGAKPAELPVEQISKLELVVNLKTARELGLAIPQSIQVRVDRVIE